MLCAENRCIWMTWSLGFFAIWLVLFLLFPKLRRPMIILGILIVPTTIFQNFYTTDFWSPPTLFNFAAKYGIDLESLIFTFFSPGVALATYLLLTSKKISYYDFPQRRSWKNLLLLYLAGLLGFFVSFFIFHLNSIYSAHIGMLCGIILGFLLTRPNLFALVCTSILFGVLYFILFKWVDIYDPNYIPAFWKVENISGKFVWNVPLEEIAFGVLGSAFYCALTEALFRQRRD
jgi:hypothetical protein